MTSREKLERLAEAMLLSEEEFDGLLGAVQGFVSMGKLAGYDVLAELPENAETIDEELLGVAAFVFWLRSDDAPEPDLHELAHELPAQITELAAAAGILA